MDISCEGYNREDDDYVLVGSCGLSYSIVIDETIQTSVLSFVLIIISFIFGLIFFLILMSIASPAMVPEILKVLVVGLARMEIR
jgi:hypothetical protein